MSYSFLLLLLLGFSLSFSSTPFPSSQSSYYTVFKDKGGYKIENVNNPEDGVASAFYQDSRSSTGWAFLNVKSNGESSDYDQMYAAGYLEGALTTDLIYAFYQNVYAVEYNSTQLPDSVINWMEQNNQYMRQQIKLNPSDPYWIHVSLILTQLQGLLDGYNDYADSDKQMTFTQFMVLNMDGDMSDLLIALNVSQINWSDDISVIQHFIYNSHCSVLVKVTDDLSELYAGHTTWTGYEDMVRIYKTYDLPISTRQASPITTFSGYPATLSSVDDYYVLSSGLIVTETTNGVMNNSLYSAVVPTTVLSFIRVIVANKMATNGSEWVEIFSKQNSGTYNNQWIIVDPSKLDRGNKLNPGALYVLEQIPGYIESADVTEILSYGYWPSYNVPFFEYVYKVSNFEYYLNKYGLFFAYQSNPRAEIFRRDSSSVHSIKDMQRMMRYNDYTKDPLSQGTPAYAISSRFDLVTGNVTNPFLAAGAFGGIDSKVTSASLAKNLTSYIQSGPSYESLPPFEWTKKWDEISHLGLAQVWNFPWVMAQYIP